MKVGTKSLLFGVHQVFLHPMFVFAGWFKLYGWPNWKELICICIHDWGYWGCDDMDGPEGEQHSLWAAEIVGKRWDINQYGSDLSWYFLCLYHSRFYVYKTIKEVKETAPWIDTTKSRPSKLCWADKLGSALYPPWLWVLLGTLTGEIKEYMYCMKHRDFIQESNPFKYFRVYRDKIVPELLKENGLIL